jgi:hypothetical protein
MDSRISKPTDRLDAMRWLGPEDLCDIERYCKEAGVAQFIHDKVLDVFRFPEDGRFAFCKEFADWDLLWERGYLDL